MLELARHLAECDESFFGGWVLAGLEAHLCGAAEEWENKVLLAKKRKCIMQVLGRKNNLVVKELRVFLVLPAAGDNAARPATGAIRTAPASSGAGPEKNFSAPVREREFVARHRFSAEEVAAYVRTSGDENIIHKGVRPIVPGICMLAWLAGELRLKFLDWRVSFLAPVYAGEELEIFRTGEGLTACACGSEVFQIKNI